MESVVRISSSFYERLIRPVLFSLDPETAHRWTLGCLRLVSSLIGGHAGRCFSGRGGVELFGLQFPNRVGLAAGFDKNGVALPAWAALGFGFVEVGTITACAQPGNPRPRIFRVPEQEALINRLGFNNEGVEKVARRLEMLRRSNRWPGIPIGLNLGKSRITPLENAVEDYLVSFRRTRDLGDYFVLNVSSPNTPGLRQLQNYEMLNMLLTAIRAEAQGKPVLLKIAPDLKEAELDGILELTEQHRLAGLIATNTTVEQESLAEHRRVEGGLSGAPLRERAMATLRYLRPRTERPLIAVGGIMSEADARARFDAGANLVQIYTGLIYRGPALIRAIAGAVG